MIVYKLKFSATFQKQLNNLDNATKIIILKYIKKHLENYSEPKSFGKALNKNYKGYWRYRFANFRIICEIKESELIVLCLVVGHRSIIYKTLVTK